MLLKHVSFTVSILNSQTCHRPLEYMNCLISEHVRSTYFTKDDDESSEMFMRF